MRLQDVLTGMPSVCSSSFLRLYPDFVAEFDQLLREDERIPLPKNGLLNAELRICSGILSRQYTITG